MEMQRVISRSELVSVSGSEDSSPEPTAAESLKTLDAFNSTDFTTTTIAADVTANPANESEDDELDFRLFSAGAKRQAESGREPTAVHKIRLRSPSVDSGKAGFIQPERNSDYYFTSPINNVEKQNIILAAVTGKQVQERAKQPWPGSAYPWKVLHLSSTHLHKSMRRPIPAVFSKVVDDSSPKKRTRPGKKYRIRVRAKKAASEAAVASKELAERENRARKNREKKLKKRARDKVKKAAAAAGTAIAGTADSDDEG
ncbi:hypothetical protein BDY17DRAFT_328123 [Neohortaea acidophila]|uniref:Uncharacterized protein n=1 Tax=Neohortaea acidophila TaxID=245834 RepID=A0A6A6PH14_9PEZI|nr:uncharacterized protein BDY17DRAFT_328123 [Neohortaea acidophila]KAF2478587.1 hypothetical protein BDY17DRAFT_328123 [Neohortaea acidophila]